MSNSNGNTLPFGATMSRRQLLKNAGAAAGAMGLAAALPGRASAQSAPLVWYAGSQADAVNDWVSLFKEKTGITCDFYRAGGLNIAQKFEQEVRAGQVACSVVSNALTGLVRQWANQGLLLQYDSPEYAHYREDMCIGRFAAPIKVDVVAMAYNSELIGVDELPKKWGDILDPKWRGKMVMADASSSSGALHWYSAMRKAFGKPFVEELSKQEVLIRTGNGEVVNTMISGERPLSCMVYQYHVETAISKGAALKVLIPEEGAPVGVSHIAIAAKGPNITDAKKFFDFTLGYDAQLLWKQKYFTGSARDDLPDAASSTGAVSIKNLKQIASSPADVQEFFEQNAEISDEWVEMFKT